jgi:lipid-A-disaccharide synthase-like uncharacterized protein
MVTHRTCGHVVENRTKYNQTGKTSLQTHSNRKTYLCRVYFPLPGVFSRVHGKATLRRVLKNNTRQRKLCRVLAPGEEIWHGTSGKIHSAKRNTRWRQSLPSTSELHTAKKAATWHITRIVGGLVTALFFAGCLPLDTRQRASLPGVFWRYTTKSNFLGGPPTYAFVCRVYSRKHTVEIVFAGCNLESTQQRHCLPCIKWRH